MVASSIGIMQHPLLQRCRVGCPFAACAPRTNIRHLRPLSCRSTEDSRQCAATSEISGKPVTRSLQKEGVEAAACQREPFRIKQAWPLAMFFGLIQPPASLAEQHSGLFAIADMDAKTASLVASILAPILTISILLMICRIPLSWYPNLNVKKLPWVIAVAPTEPILGPTRKAIPPVGGVDIAPIIWVSLLTFINEILLGPQGILNLLQRTADL